MKQIIFAMYMLLVFCGFNAAAEASPSYMTSVEASRHAAQAEKIQAARAPKLCLVWQQQFPDPSSPMGGKIPEGVTVVSPCWFEITSENGAIGNQKENDVTPEKAYIQKVHEAGCQAWPLLTNSFNAELTSKLLRNPEGQKKAIQNILGLCREYELDGINLDFENIADEDRDRLTHFAADISAALHKENKMVSIDVTAPSEMRFWSHCYDRKALSSYVDYVILMAYDEYSPFSEKAGSVASLPWVEKGIEAVLAEGVPQDKLVLGMPLYMRIWSESRNDIHAKTLRMPAAEALILEKGIVPVWLPDAGQYYFEYTEGGIRYRVWQENARSVALKSALVSRYNLAGGALWKSGVETPDVWEVLSAALKNAVR